MAPTGHLAFDRSLIEECGQVQIDQLAECIALDLGASGRRFTAIDPVFGIESPFLSGAMTAEGLADIAALAPDLHPPIS